MRLARWWTTSSRPPRRSSVTSRTPSGGIPPCECAFSLFFRSRQTRKPVTAHTRACVLPSLSRRQRPKSRGDEGPTVEGMREKRRPAPRPFHAVASRDDAVRHASARSRCRDFELGATCVCYDCSSRLNVSQLVARPPLFGYIFYISLRPLFPTVSKPLNARMHADLIIDIGRRRGA